MSGDFVIFFILALSLITTSLLTVISRRILRSAVFLAFSLLFTAFIYMLLGAEILAGIQILLYAGGVITLIIFALLISEKFGTDRTESSHHGVLPAIIASSLLFFILAYFTWISPRIASLSNSKPLKLLNPSKTLSEYLFKSWVLPLEVLSLVLLAAIIGALILAKREKEEG